MKSTNLSQQEQKPTRLQASTRGRKTAQNETPTAYKKGLKRPKPELEQIIRLVNLLPTDHPQRLETVEQANNLPDELGTHLSEVYDKGRADCDSDLAWAMMTWEYGEIVKAHTALRQLIREARASSDDIILFEDIDAGAYLSVRHGPTVRVVLSQFARAIEGAEIDYLRECEICGKLFYAGRKNQQCCTVKCAKAQRQKRWRQKYNDGDIRYHK